MELVVGNNRCSQCIHKTKGGHEHPCKNCSHIQDEFVPKASIFVKEETVTTITETFDPDIFAVGSIVAFMLVGDTTERLSMITKYNKNHIEVRYYKINRDSSISHTLTIEGLLKGAYVIKEVSINKYKGE